ncbi:hypothetical protein SLEP1_g31696 [Rubroshorea leprosula]|uniref:Dirigent protein n=1 Tax=Rubroshorea leprosula TaxID=152421 RepID=A0AAV5K449_9ROSI|nr:hypothetical protein SLEP1_g31696 [Rubroshorea leprosula]
MVRLISPILATQFTIFFIFSFFAINLVVGDDGFARTMDKKLFGMKKEKLSHFRLYWHDIVSGRNPSSVAVTAPVNNSLTGFGMIRMIDNPLTMGPELSSKMVGKAQGFYSFASQEGIGLLMAMNFAFMDEKYNGSTITIVGRELVFSEVREMPVVGGSGLFRFGRGYVQARTHWFDPSTKDAIVRYDCYVLHY